MPTVAADVAFGLGRQVCVCRSRLRASRGLRFSQNLIGRHDCTRRPNSKPYGTSACPTRYQMKEADVRDAVASALKLVNMQDYIFRATHTLSGGQRQRVAIAGRGAACPLT